MPNYGGYWNDYNYQGDTEGAGPVGSERTGAANGSPTYGQSQGYGGPSADHAGGPVGWALQQADAARQQGLAMRGQADKTNQNQAWFQNAMSRIQAFADEMSKYNPNDPLAMQLRQMSTSQAANASAGAGLGQRGLSQNAIARSTNDAATRYQMERSQMAQQAYGQLQQGALSASQQAETQREFNQQFGFNVAQYNEMLRKQGIDAQNASSPWTTATGLFAGYGGDKTAAIWGGAASNGLSGMSGGGGGGGAGGGYGPWSSFGTSVGQMTGNLPTYKPSYYNPSGGGGYSLGSSY